MKKIVLAAALSAATFSTFAADTKTPGIDERIQRQELRIQEGISKGKLSKEESDQLTQSLNKIKNDLAAAKKDGKVSGKEHAAIMKALDVQSSEINAQRKDKERVELSKVEKLIYDQEISIKAGANDGSLTASEVDQLNQKMTVIKNDLAKAQADGKVSDQEEAQLLKALDIQESEIKAQRNDLEKARK